MVTAKGTEIDTVVALEVGADDYVTKPYRLRELVARMRAVLRRSPPPSARGDQDERRREPARRRPGRPARSGSTPTSAGSSSAATRCTCGARSSSCCACWSRTPAGCSPATCSSTGSGAPTTSATPRPSTSTSSGCGPGSRPTRRARRSSRPSAASATASTPTLDLTRPRRAAQPAGRAAQGRGPGRRRGTGPGTSGSRTEPSGWRPVSTRAAQIRGQASAEPFSVWHEDRGRRRRRPVADVGPPGLVVAEPADRGHLEPAVAARGVDLEVEGPGRGAAEVPGAQVEHAVGEPERPQEPLGPRRDVGVDVGGLLARWRRRTARPCRTRGPAAAPGCRARPRRPPGGSTAVTAVKRIGQRRPRSRISPRCSEVSGTSAVGMAHRSSRSMWYASSANFGQVPGRGHRLGEHQRRRPDLLVGVGVAVERRSARQGPQQAGPGPAVEREHRPGELGAPLHVEEAERLADLPVRHPLVLGRTRAAAPRRPCPGHHRRSSTLSSGPAPSGASSAGQVGQVAAAPARSSLGGRVDLGAAARSSSPSAPALGRQLVGRGRRRLARRASPDLARERPSPGPAASPGVPGAPAGLGVERGHPVDLGRIDAPSGQRRLHRVGVLAD